MVARVAVALPLVLAPLASDAQRPQKVQRVGVLWQTTPAAASHIAAAFTEALRELGHVEGKNVAFDYRWAEDQPDRLPAIAAELIQRLTLTGTKPYLRDEIRALRDAGCSQFAVHIRYGQEAMLEE